MDESAKRVFDRAIDSALKQAKTRAIVKTRYRMPTWAKVLIAALVGFFLAIIVIVTDPMFIEAFKRAMATPW